MSYPDRALDVFNAAFQDYNVDQIDATDGEVAGGVMYALAQVLDAFDPSADVREWANDRLAHLPSPSFRSVSVNAEARVLRDLLAFLDERQPVSVYLPDPSEQEVAF